MISCWALLAYIKASDTRQNSGLAVRLPKRIRKRHQAETPPEEAPLPEEEPLPPRDPDSDPIISEDDPLYTDADNWQQYFQWEEDDP